VGSSKRQSFLFRVDPELLDALRRWADDELRSVNGQLEFIVRQALRDAGRLPKKTEPTEKTAKRSRRKG